MDVGGTLQQARRAAERSQKELARRAGVSAGALNRYEAGRALPLAMLDRLLTACGKDAQLVLVERINDLQAELARRAALAFSRRYGGDDWLRGSFLERLVRHGTDVVVGGGWAADLHGIPHDDAPGRLLLREEPELLARVAKAFMAGSVPLRYLDGHPASVPVRPETLLTLQRWHARDVGQFTTEPVPSSAAWPAEQRVVTPSGPLRLVAAPGLGPGDGVAQEVLAAWRSWRQTAGPDLASWDVTR